MYLSRYCKDYDGMSKSSKFLEDDAEQRRACESADKFLGKSKADRLDELLVSFSKDDKENEVLLVSCTEEKEEVNEKKESGGLSIEDEKVIGVYQGRSTIHFLKNLISR